MLLLAEYQGTPAPYEERQQYAARIARNAYSSSGMQGLQNAQKHRHGFIVLNNPAGLWENNIKVYWYAGEPTRSWLGKFRVLDNGELEQL